MQVAWLICTFHRYFLVRQGTQPSPVKMRAVRVRIDPPGVKDFAAIANVPSLQPETLPVDKLDAAGILGIRIRFTSENYYLE